MNTSDPLDKAFALLKARSCERAGCNPDLEERMMKEFGNANRPRMARWTKVAAAVALCVLVTGAAAATGGINAVFDWVNLTGFLETPDGSAVNVEDGNVISGEVNFQGTLHDVKGGKMLDANGNDIGTVELQTSSD